MPLMHARQLSPILSLDFICLSLFLTHTYHLHVGINDMTLGSFGSQDPLLHNVVTLQRKHTHKAA